MDVQQLLMAAAAGVAGGASHTVLMAGGDISALTVGVLGQSAAIGVGFSFVTDYLKNLLPFLGSIPDLLTIAVLTHLAVMALGWAQSRKA